MSEHNRDSVAASALHQISTRWPLLGDPMQFVLRYGPAVRRYLDALLRDPHDAEEVAQDIVVKVLQNSFHKAHPDRGRFRDYLVRSVRNAAWNHLRAKQLRQGTSLDLVAAVPDDSWEKAEREWIAEWRQCILNRAWRALDHHQRRTPNNLSYTVLRLATDRAADSHEALAAHLSQQIGRLIRTDAFRKQLSRARQRFADLVVEEVRRTLAQPTPAAVAEELTELGLMPYLRDWLSREERPGPSPLREP